MGQLLAKEHMRIVLRCIQVNGNVIYVMEEDNKFIRIKDIGIKVILIMINIMAMGSCNKTISHILDNIKTVFMMDKELSDLRMEKLFQDYLKMDKKLQENIIYLMEVIMKGNTKKECLMEGDNSDGLMVLGI